MYKLSIVIACSLGMLACSSTPKQSSSDAEPVFLQLKGNVGDKEITVYRSRNLTQSVSEDQVMQEKSDITDFTVEAVVKKAATDVIVYDLTTTEKKGGANLNDLAFPEPKENLEMAYARNGLVLKAGDHAKGSVFFLPSLPLPTIPVRPGDTWDYQGQWVSESSGVPFEVNLALILKDIENCQDSKCARIEVSGDVKMLMVNPKEVKFESQLGGDVLFAIKEGHQVSSHITSTEKMIINGSIMKIASCMGSELSRQLKGAQSAKPTEPKCELPTIE